MAYRVVAGIERIMDGDQNETRLSLCCTMFSTQKSSHIFGNQQKSYQVDKTKDTHRYHSRRTWWPGWSWDTFTCIALKGDSNIRTKQTNKQTNKTWVDGKREDYVESWIPAVKNFSFHWDQCWRNGKSDVSRRIYPGINPICGLSLLVLYSALRGFSLGTPVFPSHQTQDIAWFNLIGCLAPMKYST